MNEYVQMFDEFQGRCRVNEEELCIVGRLARFER